MLAVGEVAQGGHALGLQGVPEGTQARGGDGVEIELQGGGHGARAYRHDRPSDDRVLTTIQLEAVLLTVLVFLGVQEAWAVAVAPRSTDAPPAT
ncbi:hypothetical protein GCM10010432_71200 [Catellatospora methionotrophica]